MELRRKFNKNKTINTSYRVGEKVEEDTKIFEHDNKSISGSNIMKAIKQKQKMIIINGRQGSVNKMKNI